MTAVVTGTNFGKAASDYGTFRAGFPDSLFDRLKEFGIGMPGQVLVDLGTGTGSLARGFALRGCAVTGVDPDPRMLRQSKALDCNDNLSINYVEATAESTGLGNTSADVVTAGQCWHWFDRSRAIVEVQRVLKPGGKLVISHFDWLPIAGNVVAATESLIKQHNSDWHMDGGVGMYPQWLPGLSEAGMRGIETFSYDLDVPYTHEGWRGRIRASAGIAALDDEAAHRFDEALGALLEADFPTSVLAVPHRVFAILSTNADGLTS
jgi:SAM-dependent methyltransferase